MENRKVMVHVQNLKKNFGKLEVLKDLSIDIMEGEVVVLIGPSGSGKSTFLRCLNQLETVTSGTVLVDGDSTWLSVNPDTRRIQKPSDFKLRPAPTQTTEFCGTPAGKIQPSENLQRVSERIIRFSDIDANGHVNNARYATYIADILPETFLKKPITNFRINYAHEAKYGEKMGLWADFKNEDKIFVVGKNQDGICFESEICY